MLVFEDRVYKMNEIAAILDVSYPTLLRKVKRGDFPAGVKMGAAQSSPRRWNGTELNAWMQRQSDGGEL